MHDLDLLSTILSRFKLIPLKQNSKLPVAPWTNREFSPFDFLPGSNRAIVIGDDYCVLDVEGTDKQVSGIDHLYNLIKAHGDLPETLSWTTPSGGYAYLFKCSVPVEHKSLARTLGLELRTGQHYHLIPESRIHEKMYTWETIAEIAEVPAWLVDVFSPQRTPSESPRPSTPSKQSRSELVFEALQQLNPTCDYEQWVKIGMACKAGGLTLEDWKQWSLKGENKCEDEAEYTRKWNSFTKSGLSEGTLIHMAMQTGWEPPREEFSFPSKPKVLPEEIHLVSFPEPQGFLKELKDYFFEITNQEQYSLGATLFCMNVVTQRSYRFARCTSNIDAMQTSYHCFFGESGSSKSTIMKAARNLLIDVDPQLQLNDPRSLASIKEQLHQGPSRFLYIDEIGKELERNVYCARPNAQDVAKYTELLKLHGGDRIIAGHGAIGKDAKVGATIEPRISLMGSGTREQFQKMIATRDFIEDGFFSRLCIWQGLKGKHSLYDATLDDMKYETASLVQRLKSFHPAMALADKSPDFIHVPHACRSYMAELQSKFIGITNTDMMNSTVIRHFGAGALFASLHALGCNRTEVAEVDAEWGFEVALRLLKQSLKTFEFYQADPVERLADIVIKFLQKNGPRDYRNIQQNCDALRKVDRKTKEDVLFWVIHGTGLAYKAKDGRLTLH